jgi:hypothetical protein
MDTFEKAWISIAAYVAVGFAATTAYFVIVGVV